MRWGGEREDKGDERRDGRDHNEWVSGILNH